jgi:adenylate kinase
MSQATMLESFFKENKRNYLVINLATSTESIVKRLETRRVCENCKKVFFQPKDMGIDKCDECGAKLIQRQEDNPGVIKKRIDVYEQQTAPLVKYYEDKKKLVNIDGNPPIEVVEKEIWEKVNEN